jgi:hypothetical protein
MPPHSRIGRARAGNPAVLGLVPPVFADDAVEEPDATEEFTATARLEGRVVVTLLPESPTGEAITIVIPCSGGSFSCKGSIPEAWHLR